MPITTAQAGRDDQNSQELIDAREDLAKLSHKSRTYHTRLGEASVEILAASAQPEDLQTLYAIADRARERELDYSSTIRAAARALTEIGNEQSDALVRKLLKRDHEYQGGYHGAISALTTRSMNSDSRANQMLHEAFGAKNPVVRALVLQNVTSSNHPHADDYLSIALSDNDAFVANTALDKIASGGKLERGGKILQAFLSIARGQSDALTGIRENIIWQLGSVQVLSEVKQVLLGIQKRGGKLGEVATQALASQRQ